MRRAGRGRGRGGGVGTFVSAFHIVYASAGERPNGFIRSWIEGQRNREDVGGDSMQEDVGDEGLIPTSRVMVDELTNTIKRGVKVFLDGASLRDPIIMPYVEVLPITHLPENVLLNEISTSK